MCVCVCVGLKRFRAVCVRRFIFVISFSLSLSVRFRFSYNLQISIEISISICSALPSPSPTPLFYVCLYIHFMAVWWHALQPCFSLCEEERYGKQRRTKYVTQKVRNENTNPPTKCTHVHVYLRHGCVNGQTK